MTPQFIFHECIKICTKFEKTDMNFDINLIVLTTFGLCLPYPDCQIILTGFKTGHRFGNCQAKSETGLSGNFGLIGLDLNSVTDIDTCRSTAKTVYKRCRNVGQSQAVMSVWTPNGKTFIYPKLEQKSVCRLTILGNGICSKWSNVTSAVNDFDLDTNITHDLNLGLPIDPNFKHIAVHDFEHDYDPDHNPDLDFNPGHKHDQKHNPNFAPDSDTQLDLDLILDSDLDLETACFLRAESMFSECENKNENPIMATYLKTLQSYIYPKQVNTFNCQKNVFILNIFIFRVF